MKTSLFSSLLLTIILISCNNSYNPIRQKSPEELRMELKASEQKDYNQYLSVHYDKADYKFWTDKYQIRGYIQSTASIARFKDAVLTVSFLTETDTELASSDNFLYKFIEPNSKTDFVITTRVPNATKKFNIRIKTVVPVE